MLPVSVRRSQQQVRATLSALDQNGREAVLSAMSTIQSRLSRANAPPGAHRATQAVLAPQEYHLGSELAFKEEKDGKMLFVIGGKPQTEADFEDAWEEALDYVRHFDDETLKSGEEFFASVYRPKRDEFAAKWSEMVETPKPIRRRTK